MTDSGTATLQRPRMPFAAATTCCTSHRPTPGSAGGRPDRARRQLRRRPGVARDRLRGGPRRVLRPPLRLLHPRRSRARAPGRPTRSCTAGPSATRRSSRNRIVSASCSPPRSRRSVSSSSTTGSRSSPTAVSTTCRPRTTATGGAPVDFHDLCRAGGCPSS